MCRSAALPSVTGVPISAKRWHWVWVTFLITWWSLSRMSTLAVPAHNPGDSSQHVAPGMLRLKPDHVLGLLVGKEGLVRIHLAAHFDTLIEPLNHLIRRDDRPTCRRSIR